MKSRPVPAIGCSLILILIALMLTNGSIAANDKKSKQTVCSNPHPEQLSLCSGDQAHGRWGRCVRNSQHFQLPEGLGDLHCAWYERDVARRGQEHGHHGRLWRLVSLRSFWNDYGWFKSPRYSPHENSWLLQVHGRRLQSRLDLRHVRKLGLRSYCDRRQVGLFSGRNQLWASWRREGDPAPQDSGALI